MLENNLYAIIIAIDEFINFLETPPRLGVSSFEHHRYDDVHVQKLMELDSQTEKTSWAKMQDEIAEDNGLAIVVVQGSESVVVSKSNNNSICEQLYSSDAFASHCAQYCGKAFDHATNAGKTVSVKCHADLNFLAVPFKAGEKPLVAIVGRSFLRSEDYRRATERASSGDWQQFPPEEFFSNVLISSSINELEDVAKRFEKLGDAEKQLLLEFEKSIVKLPEEIESAVNVAAEEHKDDAVVAKTEIGNSESLPQQAKSLPPQSEKPFSKREITESKKSVPEFLPDNDHSADVIEINAEKSIELAGLRSLLGSLLNLTYREACGAILKFLGRRYKFSELGWLERKGDSLDLVLAGGGFRHQQMEFSIAADDNLLLEAVKSDTSLEFRERQTDENVEPQSVQVFPIAVGGEIRGATIVGDKITDETLKRHIARFMRSVTSELEILRLREEIERQTSLSNAVQRFNQTLKNIDSDDTWELLTQTSAEIMQAERGSLLKFDEDSQKFTLKAAIGSRADIIKREGKDLGERIAHKVLEQGRPMIVKDIQISGFQPAPLDWNYKTKSFISYPIIINGKKIGVLNISDKVDGTAYDEFDLRLMNSFAPQLAVALDNTSLKTKAGEFERLSITDSLTGLLNRRYLEERVIEEIKRWERDGHPVSFMMIDVDEFKSYNDTFTHPEGDKALQTVANVLKASSRGADVAARYGGEEFSILLPQTTLGEAYTIGERLRERIAKTRFPNRQVTISIGIATCSPNLRTSQQLISAADKALYKAKQLGRNNVQKHLEPETDKVNGNGSKNGSKTK